MEYGPRMYIDSGSGPTIRKSKGQKVKAKKKQSLATHLPSLWLLGRHRGRKDGSRTSWTENCSGQTPLIGTTCLSASSGFVVFVGCTCSLTDHASYGGVHLLLGSVPIGLSSRPLAGSAAGNTSNRRTCTASVPHRRTVLQPRGRRTRKLSTSCGTRTGFDQSSSELRKGRRYVRYDCSSGRSMASGLILRVARGTWIR